MLNQLEIIRAQFSRRVTVMSVKEKELYKLLYRVA